MTKAAAIRSSCLFVAVVFLVATAAAAQAIPDQHLRNSTPPARAYQPITGRQRFHWFLKSTIGLQGLTAGLFSAGFGTAVNRPTEYGPHWSGFGKRYAMRLTGISTGNAMEAGFGALWGEDPRYFRASGQSFKGRLKHVAVMTFVARQADGSFAPAYARYIGTVGNNLLSNTWRPDSESGLDDALVRILLGFAGRMGSDAFAEFWPDARKHILPWKH